MNGAAACKCVPHRCVHRQLPPAVARSTERHEVRQLVRLRVPVRVDVVDVQIVERSTVDAAVLIALQGEAALRLPFPDVRCRRAAPPEVASLRALRHEPALPRTEDLPEVPGAAEGPLTGETGRVLNVRSIRPAVREIATARAELRRTTTAPATLERLAARHAHHDRFREGRGGRQPLVPRLLGDGGATLGRAVDPRVGPPEHDAAALARLPIRAAVSAYFLDAVKYLQAEERKQGMPSLFDALEAA